MAGVPEGAARFSRARELLRSRRFRVLLLLAVAGAVAAAVAWASLQTSVYIDDADVEAPLISAGPPGPGTLERVMVREGDEVHRGMVLAWVGGAPITSLTDGVVVSALNTPGQQVGSQTPVVQMYDPRELRVVGHLEEDKGLSDIRVGKPVTFTVDAFGSRLFQGVVERVSPSARASDVVFSISDKRPEQKFDVTVRFDVAAYSELKNGMSARMWVAR